MKIITYLFASILAASCAVSLAQTPDIQDNSMRKRQIKENPYSDLRNRAIHVSPEELQIETKKDELYGVIMDWNMGDAVVTVTSFITGDGSVSLSTGQAFIGGIAHETVINAAKSFVRTAKEYLPKAEKTDKSEPAPKSMVVFYFLTEAGRYYTQTEMQSIEQGTSELIELFTAANQVITEYRLITQ